MPYLTKQSDLDLLWQISDEHTALSLVQRLSRLDAESPVRLDGELELPDGAGVNWRQVCPDFFVEPGEELLVKTMDGVEVRTCDALFRTHGVAAMTATLQPVTRPASRKGSLKL